MSSTNKTRIPQNTLYLLTSQVAEKFVSLLFVSLVARHLKTAGYGELAFIFSSTYLLTIFMDFGINTILVREIARSREKAKEFLFNAFILKIYLAFFVLILLFSFTKLTPFSPHIIIPFYIIGIAVIITSMAEIFRSSYFIAVENALMKGLLTISHRVTELIFTFLSILFGGGLLRISTAIFLASLLNFFFSFCLARKDFHSQKSHLSLITQRKILLSSLPVGIGIVFLGIYNRIDTVMLSFMKGNVAVGIYNAAYRIMEVLVFIPASLSGALLPVLSRFFKSSPKKFRSTFIFYLKWGIIIAFPIAVIIGFFPQIFVRIIFGKAFFSSTKALIILIWTFPLITLNYILRTFFIASDRERMNLYFFLTGAILNTGLNFLLIPRWSYKGASTATLLTEVWGTIFLLFVISLSREKHNLRETLEKPLIAAMGMACAIHYGMRINNLFAFLAGCFSYFMLLLVQETFTREELKAVKNLVVLRGKNL
ncbi:flippase [Candidatus Calescamantes bacterium]|nr:flippase [Candidatus Calescamantes bacterium]